MDRAHPSRDASMEATRRESEVLARLQKDLRDKRLAIVVGAGITLSATADASGTPLSRITWTGLIQNGLDFLVSDGYVGRSNRITKPAYEALEDPDIKRLLNAANILTHQLKQHGQFPTWLQSVFGSLDQDIRHPAILKALKGLYENGAILLTTNYDDILEKYCGSRHIGRSKIEDIIKFRRGDLDGVFHLHGSYHDPQEVVLDTTGYYQVRESDDLQNMLKAFLDDKTILFVGCGSGLEDPNFDRLLKWAAERQKNIPNTHCLLVRDGDSLVYKPLLRVKYGPNYHDLAPYLNKLLHDRQAGRPQILAQNSSEATTRPQQCWTVPFTRNAQFVGRESQLEGLESILFTEDQPSKVAITGLGGVGKTQVVLELAYRTRMRYSECSILWLPATNAESLQQAYLEAGRLLGISGLEEEQADVKKLVQRHLSQESAGRWLLIFDNADDIDMWMRKAEDEDGSLALKEYLPRSSQGRIVFTTRSRKIAVKLAQQNVVSVSEMDEDMARRLLIQSLINPDLVINDQETRELLQQLTFLPLAIVQAAAYINENGITFSDYLSLLKDQEQDAIDLLSEDFEDEGRYQEIKNPIAVTWLISFEQIRRLDPLAADYLWFMCCIDPRDIPQSLLLPMQSRKKKTDAIGTLSAYSFVSRRSADDSFDLHRLVHLATRNWLRREELLAQWTLKAVIRLDEVFPDVNHKNRNLWRAYLPHACYILNSSLINNEHPKRIELLWKYSKCLYSDGRYIEAEGPISQVIKTRKRVLGDEHHDTLSSISKLVSTYRNQGRWKEAEELGMQVMETRKRILGHEHLNTLTSIANLASTYWNQGRWKEAEKLELRVMETRKRVLGHEHPNTLISMANLASTYWNQGRWKEAEKLDMQVMETRKRILGHEHPNTLTSIANLASTYWNQGRWKEAEKLGMQVMETRKRILGHEHPNTLTSIANLASTYWNQGRWKEAEELELRVIETRKRVLGHEHPNTLISMANLASTYRDQGRWKEAEELGMQIMEARKRILGHEHPNTLTSIANLASTYWNQGRWKEAEELELRVIETRKRVLGHEHPNTLISMANLASTYRDQGRWKEAEELDMQIMEARKRILGHEHPNTLTSIANLASTYWNQGRWKEAEKLELRVIETRKRVLGHEHPNTLISMANLASTYQNQRRWEEAEKLNMQVIEARKRILGHEHPNTLNSMCNLASTYQNQRRWKEAEKLNMQVIEARKRILGHEHPNTLNSMGNLASTYQNQGRWKEAEKLDLKVIEARKRILGHEHPGTLGSMANLALTQKCQGRDSEALDLMEKCFLLQKQKLGPGHPNTVSSLGVLNEWKTASLGAVS